MNTENKKKHKSADYCETPSNNGGAEVFVLPPNLLEKLGIKLDKIVSTGTLPPERNYSSNLAERTILTDPIIEEGYFERAKPVKQNNESSILETASLMKESVFLSPTFVPTVANVISGEVEIAEHAQRQNVVAENQMKEADCFPVEISLKQNDCNNHEASKTVQPDPLKAKHTNDSIQCEFVITADKCVVKESLKNVVTYSSPRRNRNYHKKAADDNITKSVESPVIDTEIHLINGVDSPNSNSRLEYEHKEVIPINKKIQVINEEAVDIAKLYRRKSLNPNVNNNVLTPITMGMLLTTAKTKIDELDSKEVEKCNGSEQVVSLLHDIGSVDTDVRQSEKFCDFVVSDVEHVDVFCFDHQSNLFNISNNDSILIDEVMDMDENGEIGTDTTLNVSNLENNVEDNSFDVYFETGEKMRDRDSNDFLMVMDDTDLKQSDASANTCNQGSTESVPKQNIDNDDLENFGKFDLYHGSQSTDCKISIDLDIKCLMNENESWDTNKDECLTEQIVSEKKKILSEILSCNNNDKEINKSKTILRKSKLCIQGVEKPGGDDVSGTTDFKDYGNKNLNQPNIINKTVKDHNQCINDLPESSLSDVKNDKFTKNMIALKTYKRERKTKTEVILYSNNFATLQCGSHDTHENNDSTAKLDDVCRTRDFCLCGDFGQLKYYDYDSSYEHIHFWEHKDVTCDRDLIFSIYDVDFKYNYDCADRSIEIIDESADELVNKICWNEIYDDVNYSNNINDDCKKCSNENQNVVTMPLKLSSQTNFETDDSKFKRKISQSIKPSNIIATENNTIGVDAEKNADVKERSDIIYNTCSQTVETNKHHESDEGVIGCEVESTAKKDIQSSDITSQTRVKKRKGSITVTLCDSSTDTEEPQLKKDVKCGVCGQVLAKVEWERHSSEEHGLIAWTEGQTLDFKNEDLLSKIQQKLMEDGFLKCWFCNIKMGKFEPYMSHVQDCIKAKTSESKNYTRRSSTIKETVAKPQPNKYVNCGVCRQDVKSSDWVLHISQTHNYLAWKSGEPVLDLNDTDQVEKHLSAFIKDHGPIICSQCGFERKYGQKRIKKYLEHITTCNKLGDTSVKENDAVEEKVDTKIEEVVPMCIDSPTVKCGVCGQILPQAEWEQHSSKEHGLIAWIAGQAIDFNDEELLIKIQQKLKKNGVLKCGFCNIEKKKVKRYVAHVQECIKAKFTSENRKRRSTDKSLLNNFVKCGVCGHDVKSSDWLVHICQKHNYLAWKSGEPALNLDATDQVEKHLCAIIKAHGSIICSRCGFDRKYRRKGVKTYLDHIKTCNKVVDTLVKESDAVEEKVYTKIEEVVPMCVDNQTVKCGVCGIDVSDSDWIHHIRMEHNYLAWKHGEDSVDLDDKEQVTKYLNALSKKYDGLLCSKCGLKRKYVKKFLSHIKNCDGTPTNESQLTMNESQFSDINDMSQTNDGDVGPKCGVCLKCVPPEDWFHHIGKKHNYLAWKVGEPKLKKSNEGAIEDHLNNIMREYGRLNCRECGQDFKFEVDTVASYLSHTEACAQDEDVGTEGNKEDNVVKCGVCEKDVKESVWIKHIENKHNYLAWKEGETPLVLDDNESIRLYLFTIINKVEAFKCSKCGVQKKYPKSFITHLESCNASVNETIDENVSSSETCECAVCSEIVEARKWKHHAMSKHYNIAWKVGEFPIDLKSSYGTEKYLKEYKQRNGKLVCKTCGISRMSPMGFYAHILTCGKTEEELDEFRNLCEVCNNKYLCIYKNQHMAFHREQEYAKENKLKALEMKETAEQEATLGRRKAAVKANDVIEKLNSSTKFKHTCSTCGFDTDCEKKLARHKCVTATFEHNSETEESCDSDDINEIDLSEEEDLQDTLKRKKNKESIVQAKVPNVPFKYNEVKSYTAQSNEDFYKVHYTNETLFSQWLKADYESLSDEKVSEYLPAMEQSCQIKLSKEWTSFKRFEAKPIAKGFSIFVGASVQCVSWVPPPVDGDDTSSNYLAVSCHQGSDSPRYNYDELAKHAGLIQIWDFGDFQKAEPNFVMGLAHDYGTIWAMEWCPSGAREICGEDKEWARLGLLAVACSDGLVYILSVPYPCTVAESGALLKLKAVAILKLAMEADRRLYQATALTWSKQKGHTFVSVGYADGTTALYDVTNNSPLLNNTVDGITVLYPYHDEREHNVSVTDMDSFPVESASGGVVSSASLGRVAAVARPAAAQARLLAHASATGCRFAPGWPSVMIAVDDSIASQAPNELEWYGCARRLGPMRASCGCARCGRALLHAPPVLRLVRALPPYADLRKQNILGIRALPLTKKRERANDELSMQVEPLTYDEVVTQYGIEIFFVDANDKNNSINTVKEQWTERFPLPDVTSMAFCPAEKHHHRVAVALHAGFVLVVPVH